MPRVRPRARSYDDLLRPYVEGREIPSFPPDREAVDIAQRDLREQIDSEPPPAGLSDSRQRVLDRVGPDTGSHDLRALEAELRQMTERAAAEKLAALARSLDEEKEKRREVLGELKELRSDRRKFWSAILVGITIGLVVGLVSWTAMALVAHTR